MKKLMSKIKSVAVAALTMGLALGAQAQVQVTYLAPIQRTTGIGGGRHVASNDEGWYVVDRYVSQSAECHEIASGASQTLSAGWYVASGEVDIASTLTIDGEVSIVLRNGATLKVNEARNIGAGLRVEEGSSLAVYAQSADASKMGKFIAYNGKGAQAVSGTLTINGGEIALPDMGNNVTVNGGKVTTDIGDGATINGGTVTANVGDNATINGGIVTANVGDDATVNGGSINATSVGNNATIAGGTVTATSIGKNATINGGQITAEIVNTNAIINAGTVTATKILGDKIVISGGSVKAKFENDGITPVNASGATVQKTTVTGVEESPAEISGLRDYGVSDLYPDNGTLYLYLPSGDYNFNSFAKQFTGKAGETLAGIAFYGMSVNATDIGKGSGNGWTFDAASQKLTLSSAMDYNLSGADRSGLVRVKVTASNANVTLDNLTLPLTNQEANAIEFAESTTNSLILKGENTVYGQEAAIKIASGAMVTLSGTGELVGGENSRAFTVDGELVINGGTISGCSAENGGAIYSTGTLTMNGGTIQNCTASNGGAIYNEGTLTMNGGTINGCSASEKGGTIYNGGTLTINGGTINGCSAIDGGALFNDGTANIYGGTFAGSSASGWGGFCYCNKDRAVSIYGGYFSGNTAPSGQCNLYYGCAGQANGKLYGGVFAADPLSTAESQNCLVAQSIEQGAVEVTKVGNFYVVGIGVQSQNGALTAGTYTFNPRNLEYVNAGLDVLTGCTVTEQAGTPRTFVVTPLDDEFRVNGTAVSEGSGEGWSFDQAKNALVLSNEMEYVLSGNAAYAVDVTADATITLSDVRIHAGALERAVFNVTGADVTLTLGGSNEVYTTDGNAAFGIANGATLTMAGDGALWGSANSRCVSVATGGAFEMAAGEIRGYTSTTGGSAIQSAGEATINGGQFSENGGTTLISNTGTLLVNNGSFCENSSATLISGDAGTLSVRGGVFTGNSSTTLTSGAGVVYGGVYDVEPAATAVAEGYAAKQVGALYVVGQGVTAENAKLTGGTYTFDPKGDDYAAAGLVCAPQYAVVPQGTVPETYGVKAEAEFQVNGVAVSAGSGTGWTYEDGCLTLSENMDYTLTGYATNLTFTVDVLSNATVTLDGIRIRADKPQRDIFRVFGDGATLILSGTNTVFASDGNAAIGVTGGARLSVKVEVENGDGCLVGGRTSGIEGRAFNVSGELVLEGGTIRDYYAANGGAIYNAGAFEMDGGTISGCLATSGGAIYNSGTLAVYGGTIANCTAVNGGALCNSGTLAVYGGTIANCTAVSGGALCNNGTASIYGGTFTDNSASEYGGFCYCDNNCVVSIYGGYFAGNTSAGQCNLFYSRNQQQKGKLYGGVFAANPMLTAESRNCLACQGYAQAVAVGDLWVVGTGVQSDAGKLSYGTYTFDPQEGEYAAVGLALAERRIVTAQGTSLETYLVDWNYTGLKIGYLDDDGNIVNVKDAIEGGSDWSICESNGLVTLNAARSDDEPYVIMGQNTREDLDLGVAVAANNAWVLFTNATIATTSKAAFAVNAANVTLLMAGDSKLTSKESDALTCSAGKSVAFRLADDDAAVDSVTLTVSSIGGAGSVLLGGEYYYGYPCGTIEVTGDIDVGTLTVKNGILKVEGGIVGDTIAIQGGRTTVEGKSGIVGGTVTIGDLESGTYYSVGRGGGTVVADTIEADGSVVINGGSVKAGKVTNPKTTNADYMGRTDQSVWCVTFMGVTNKIESISSNYLSDYGTEDIYPIDYEICLWMPNTEDYGEFYQDEIWVEEKDVYDQPPYYAVVKDAPTVAYHKYDETIELYVNGEQVPVDGGEGTGWEYETDNYVLTLTPSDADDGTNSYVITGTEMMGRVRIVVAGSCDVSFTGQLGYDPENPDDYPNDHLITINEDVAVNLTFSDTTFFKPYDGYEPLCVQDGATANILGSGTVYNFDAKVEEGGKITMADPKTLTFVTQDGAEAMAEKVTPIASEADFPGIDQDEYMARVKAVAVESSTTPGTWTLDYQINADGTNDIQAVFTEAYPALVENVTNNNPSVTFTPVVGFYYALVGATTVEGLEAAIPSAWYAGQQDQELTVSGSTFAGSENAYYRLVAASQLGGATIAGDLVGIYATLAVTNVEHATAKVYTDEGEVTGEEKEFQKEYVVRWSMEARVVYTADEGYEFAGGAATWETTVTASAATVTVTIPESEKPTKKPDPVEYLEPVYKTVGVPTSGIDHWETNSVSTFTVVTKDITSWNDGWYVVNEDVTIDGSVTCGGHVNLVLCDGATLTVNNSSATAASIETDEDGSFTVYGQENGTGALNVSTAQYSFGAAIGGGNDGAGSNITINGGTVTASCGEESYGAAIGGGNDGAGSNITINGGTVTASCGEQSKGAGIGGGGWGAGSNITINGGTVTASCGEYASGAAIGGGECGEGSYITINSGTVTATGYYGAGIGGGYERGGSDITINGGKVTASGYYGAGIGSGSDSEAGSNITINGGQVTATGGDGSAGIGGGDSSAGLYITINGGEVNATGGKGAAIGGGHGGAGSYITINGGTVTATCGEDSSGAAIGGGEYGEGSYITINSGTVTATCGDYSYGAAIGGGEEGAGSNITINGGIVTATGGNYEGDSVSAIGSGYDGEEASNIFVADNVVIKADNSNPPTTVIEHASITTDIAGALDGKRYATAEEKPVQTVTVDAASLATKGLVATNATVNGVLVGLPCQAVAGATVVVWFKPTYGMKFKGSATSYQFTMGTSAVTIDATTEGLPETESAYVFVFFYDYGGNPIAGAQESYSGLPNTWFTASNEVLNAAASFEAQIPGTWWNGTWNDGCDPVAFPVKFTEESGNEYHMTATNITYSVGTEDAGDEVYVMFDSEETTSYDIDSGLEEASVTVSDDPGEDPTGAGRTFLGWTCEYFNITTPTKLADMDALTMPESFDTWDDVGDIIFVANWEEPPEEATITVTPVTGASKVTVSNGTEEVKGPPYVVYQGDAVTVVYTADEGYEFAGGETTWTTNFTASAATVTVTIPESERPREVIEIGDLRAEILNGGCEITGSGSGELTKDIVDTLKDKAITNLVIGAGVTGIGKSAFENWSTLRDVTLGADCTAVGAQVFHKCRNLTNVTCQAAGAVTVGDYAFYRCSGLESLNFASMPEWGKRSYSFYSGIYMADDGVPVVYAMPTITVAGFRQVLKATNDLSDPASWVEVNPNDAEVKKSYHFFKIELEAVK